MSSSSRAQEGGFRVLEAARRRRRRRRPCRRYARARATVRWSRRCCHDGRETVLALSANGVSRSSSHRGSRAARQARELWAEVARRARAEHGHKEKQAALPPEGMRTAASPPAGSDPHETGPHAARRGRGTSPTLSVGSAIGCCGDESKRRRPASGGARTSPVCAAVSCSHAAVSIAIVEPRNSERPIQDQAATVLGQAVSQAGAIRTANTRQRAPKWYKCRRGARLSRWRLICAGGCARGRSAREERCHGTIP